MIIKKLKPRYPTSGSRAARADLPAAVGGYSLRFRCEVSEKRFSGCKVVNCGIRLAGEPEQPGDEECLADRIPFCQPSHSALVNHVHRFDSL